jgi:Flp pilus assembly protein protease CpaA
MKRLIALIVIFAFVGGGSVFAVQWGKTIGGLLLTGFGGVCLYGVADDEFEDYETFAYPFFGAVAVGGLVLTIVGLSSSSKSKQIASAQEDNPLRYVMLDVTPNSVTVGFRKSF